jgi:peptide/nickel transport system substrate-binding protein
MTPINKRGNVMLGRIAASCVLATSVFFATAAFADDQCPVRGGSVTIPFAPDPGDLTPSKKAQFPPSLIYDQIYDTLLRFGPNGLEPGLATKYEIAPDKLSVTFSLRHGVMFHHGREFEAKDVVFTLNRILDPKFNSPWAGQLSSIEKVEALDKYTVKISLKQPFAPILSILATAWYTAIVPYDFAGSNNLNEKASGTGPFTLVEYVPNDHVLLKANPNYWEKGYPCIDSIRYNIVPEQQAQISAFRQGNADLVAINDPKFIALLQGKPGSKTVPPAGPVNESGLAINTAEGPTSDIRVRRALSVGMDRKGVIDTVLFGHGEIGTKIPCGEVPYGWCQGKDPELPYYKYDPDQAKKLLAEAGYGNGLDLTIQVSLPLDVQTAEILADQWKKIGVNLKIQQIPDFNQQLDNYIHVKDQLSIVTLVWQPDPHADVYPIYYSTSKINLGKFKDKELDALLDAGKSEVDVQKRVKIYKDIQRLVADKVYMLYPFTKPVNWQYVKDYVNNYKAMPSGSFFNLRYTWLSKK